MGTLSASGIGSGIDVAGIVNQLVAAERAPQENRIKKQEDNLNSQLSAIGKIKSKLSEFESALEDLKSADSFQPRSAISSDDTNIKVTGSSTAVAGSYSVDLSYAGAQLAQSNKLASAGAYSATTDVIGTGTLTLELGTYDSAGDTYASSSLLNITIDSSNNTLEGIRDAINSAGIDISASIINDGSNYRLALSSDNTGVANVMKVSVSGDGDGNDTDAAGLSAFVFDPATAGTKNLTETVAAQDAKFKVDGIEITSSNNKISDAIQGVTLELKKTGISEKIDVTADEKKSKEQVTKLVDSYNSLIKTINDVSRVGSNGEKGGALSTDSMIRRLNSTLHQVVGSESTSGTSFSSLAALGFKSSTTDGTLELDSSKLDAAFANNYDDVGTVISEYANSFISAIDNYTGSAGLVDGREDSYNDRLKLIEKQKEQLDSRMEMVRDRYSRQFNAMDSLVAKMNNTMGFLSSQLATLPGAR